MTESMRAGRTARHERFHPQRRIRRHRRMLLRPTPYGWAYLLLVTAMLVGSINYGNNFGFLLTFLLAGVGIVSVLHTWRSLRGIVLAGGKALPVFAGEQAVFDIVVRGGAVAAAAVEIGIEGDPGATRRIDLDADENRRIRLHLPAPQRGWWFTGPCVAATIYPLGFFRGRIYLADHFECLVYPAPLASDLPPVAAYGHHAVEAAVDVIRAGSDDFQGLNVYRPGDPILRISWKASSRGQGIYTKEFSTGGGVTWLLDWESVPVSEPEQKLSLLCGQVIEAERSGNTYGLKIPGRFIPPGNGEAHRHRCLEALARFPESEAL